MGAKECRRAYGVVHIGLEFFLDLVLGAEECRRAYGAPDLKSWIVGNLLMTEVVNLEPDLSSLLMLIL